MNTLDQPVKNELFGISQLFVGYLCESRVFQSKHFELISR